MNKNIFPGLLSALIVLGISRSATVNELAQADSSQHTPGEHRAIGSQVIPKALKHLVLEPFSPKVEASPVNTVDSSSIQGNITSPGGQETLPIADMAPAPEVNTDAYELTPNSGNADLNESDQSAHNNDLSSTEAVNADQADGNGDKSDETGDTTEPSSNQDQPSTRSAPPQSISIKILPGRTAEITIVAPEGSAYRVERSLDLVNWSLLAKGIANSTFQDKDAVNHSSAFYRVVPK